MDDRTLQSAQQRAARHGWGRRGGFLLLAAAGCAALSYGLFAPRVPSAIAQAPASAEPESTTAEDVAFTRTDWQLVPVQYLSPAQPHCITGIDCAEGGNCGEFGWKATSIVPFQVYAQGEYVGHDRIPHVPEYRLRVDDRLEFVYRVTRNESPEPYRLNVGDIVDVESFTDEGLNRELVIQPDGTITLRLLGQVKAARLTVTQLTEELNKLYMKYYKEPAITVTPLKVNTKLEDLRAAVDARAGQGGQNIRVRVTPEGTIQLPVLGSVPVHGLTLDEARRELNERYAQEIDGMEITPVLQERAPRYCYVLGEVKEPGRFTLEAPTTVMQAIALAKGWNVGANLRQVVIFRRGDDWRLMATMLDLRGALYGKKPCPADEIWLNDTDLVVVPKSPVLVFDDMINLVFTRGVYGVVPFSTSVSYTNVGTVF
ncbi:MAG: polysaccharide biosynthesis/export family protein [Pirellulales bacterium]|nr:polysaccharide biosynthesis/export family protein [Pirellulales bacterium]